MEIGYINAVYTCVHTEHVLKNSAASFQPLGFAEAPSNSSVPKAGCKCTGLAWLGEYLKSEKLLLQGAGV